MNAEAHLVALYAKDGDRHLLANLHGLPDLAAQNQHAVTLRGN